MNKMTMARPAIAGGSIGGERHEKLLGLARELAPVFAERAAATEALGRLSPESERELHESGLYRMLQPQALGGAELDYVCLITLGAAVAAGCASTAWTLTNIASHHWMLAMFPEAAQKRIWNENRDALIASSFVFPAAKAEKAPGGHVVSGRWPFSSGVDACDWNMLAGIVRTEGEEPDHRVFLLHRDDYEIIDNWQVSGLKGTGSKDVRCEGVFVPEHMSVSVANLKGGPTPGSDIHPNPVYRIPVFALFPAILSGTGLGNAEGALDAFLDVTRKRTAAYNAAKLAEMQAMQVRVGLAASKLATSRRTMVTLCEQAMADACRGFIPDVAQKLAYRRDLAQATIEATEALDIVNGATGAHALYLSNPMQRRFRDGHAVAAHIAFSSDVAMSAYGRVALGLPTDNHIV
jgi:3-hydroxy-9,10-secoandrosta-1,3,5(10)-triene-9,17-dione monooxygenase